MTGIIILIDIFRCLKEAETMDMTLGLSVNLNIGSLFSATNAVGIQWNGLKEAIPMCSYNICLSNKSVLP